VVVASREGMGKVLGHRVVLRGVVERVIFTYIDLSWTKGMRSNDRPSPLTYFVECMLYVVIAIAEMLLKVNTADLDRTHPQYEGASGEC